MGFSTKKVPKKSVAKKAQSSDIIVEDIPADISALGLNSSFAATQDDDAWGDDWGTPAVKVKSAAEKKAERDAKMKARKAEMEKKRAAKKATSGVKLGTR